MFIDGKIYEVKQCTALFQLALAEWLDQHLPFVQYLADHLLTEPLTVTEDNRKSVMHQLDLSFHNPRRADIVTEAYRRRWEKAKAESEADNEQP